MKADEAVRFVQGLAFKPGWQPTAERIAGDLVELSFIIRTVDTSYPDPDGVCRNRITIYGQQRLVNVTYLDEEGLLAEVLKCAASNDEHENREFLKVRQPDGSWHAPLHPHTDAGNRAWERHQRSRPQAQTSSAAGLMQLLGLED